MTTPTSPIHDPVRLAYMTNQYPAVSHTFIRRELLELERRGHTVARFAIRPARTALVDPADLAEAEQTFYCLERTKVGILVDVARTKLTHPIRFTRALRTAFVMGRRSRAGVLKHLIYLAEACVLARELERQRIEHVHVHFGTNPATVARLAHLLGGPGYSLTIHGPDELDDPVGHDLAGKIRDARFTVAISDYTRSQLMRWADRADWGRIHVVRCTVGDEYLGCAPVEPPTGVPTFVNVGRLSAQKGQLVLIDAFAQLLGRVPRARLVIVGDGEMRADVERAVAQHGIGDRVELTGSLPGDAVRERLAAAHALVLPSFAEGLPMVIMEAFAAGTPVISTAIAGIPELIEHGRSGVVLPAGRADLVADAMETLASTPAPERGAMARIGRTAVEARHRTSTEGERLESLILAALSHETGAGA
ncbi:MAG: colanic acid biosynthesis glycosyltransferase WcaL [Phycisphaeraceae bacterium]|nr:MAG: colanic acid biosynthesis glycosyltransferase WcaL [Phycisphaeraceae bacterium]